MTRGALVVAVEHWWWIQPKHWRSWFRRPRTGPEARVCAVKGSCFAETSHMQGGHSCSTTQDTYIMLRKFYQIHPIGRDILPCQIFANQSLSRHPMQPCSLFCRFEIQHSPQICCGTRSNWHRLPASNAVEIKNSFFIHKTSTQNVSILESSQFKLWSSLRCSFLWGYFCTFQ